MKNSSVFTEKNPEQKGKDRQTDENENLQCQSADYGAGETDF